MRFPEFKGEWELKKLGKISKKINSGKTPLGGQAVYVESGILFIRSQNVLVNKLSFENSTFITEKINNTMKNSVVASNDILLNITGASLGRSCVVPKDFSIGNVNQHVCIIRLNKENEPTFVQPIFASEKGQNIFTSLQSGSGREGLNFQSIRGITLAFPTLPEQQKIASFLTAVDEKLQALKQKKSLLEQYKKGVMQQIFSQVLRFKDDTSPSLSAGNGKDFPDWEEKILGKLCTIKKGQQLNKEELTETGDYPCINGGINFSGYTDKFNTLENTITISEGGNSCGYVNLFKVKFWSGGHNYSIIINCTDEYNNDFLFQILKFNETAIMRLRVGSGLPNIQKKDLIAFVLIFPKSKKEQTKIANFLSAIDDKINHCQLQIEKTTVWKKGLLQQMFC